MQGTGERVWTGKRSELGFSFIHLPCPKQNSCKIKTFRVTLWCSAIGIVFKGREHVPKPVSTQGIRQLGLLRWAKCQFVRIQDSRVIEPPLHDIRGLDYGSFARGLADDSGPLFSAKHDDRAKSV